MRRTEVKSVESKSLEYINNPSEWIVWPVVPLIHLKRTNDSGIGIEGLLFDEDRTEGYKVYHANLFAIPRMSQEKFEALEVSKYPTVEALLRDWRVD